MPNAVYSGKRALEIVSQQKSGKAPSKGSADTVKASGAKAAAKKPVKKKK